MAFDIGLPDLLITGELETWSRLRYFAEPGIVSCPSCNSDEYLSDGKLKPEIVVGDTPARGKPTEIMFTPCAYRCRVCRRGFDAHVQGVDQKRRMTDRLIRYIENQSPRRTRDSIAREVGVHSDRVRRIVVALADRLEKHHRFPTPRVLGIDDIRLNKKFHTIFTDAETGRAIGLIPSVASAAIGKWISDYVDRTAVSVIVSDLGDKIVAAVGDHLPGKLHIADPWHVMRGCRKAMGSLVAEKLADLKAEADDLRKQGKEDGNNEALKAHATLKAARRHLVGRKSLRLRPSDPDLFDDRPVQPLLDDDAELSKGFYARITLAKMYRCNDEGVGIDHLDTALRILRGTPTIQAFAGVATLLNNHRSLILNYFKACRLHPEIAPSAFTTSSTERRNGMVKTSWRAGRGVTRLSYLRLLALYQPWQFDVDIVECGEPGCARIEGPVGVVPGLSGQKPDDPVTPGTRLRCSMHG